MLNTQRPHLTRRWKIAHADSRAVDLARNLGTSPLTAQMLINRGLIEIESARAFLRPALRDLIDPSELPGCAQAAQRIARAIHNREAITVYGDYDVDGITAIAILWHGLRALGANVRHYIPHRIDEGYGLNSDAIRQLCEDGTQLLITVDCGITAIEPVNIARDRNVDVIVTDHHEWKTVSSEDGSETPHFPEANFIVHPRLDSYPNPHLCGAGVAFKLAWAVGQEMGSIGSDGSRKVPESIRDLLVDLTALAALGTIADVVPLVGENRILSRFGLGGLKGTKLTGLRALIRSANLEGENIDSYHVGFLLGPRLNACGRMGHAKLAVEMLTDASPARAMEIATFLEQQNRQRQETEREILKSAQAQAIEFGMAENEHAIVVGGAGWHAGVIGIVASRLVDRFHKPAVVISLGEDHGHGSARSISGFHLARALSACSEHLEKHGGHEMAAGLGLHPSRFEDFRRAFLDHARQSITPEQLIPEIRIDTLAMLEQISESLVNEMQRLGPFGQGNPRPLLACKNLTLTAAPKRVGKTGDHLQLFLRQNDRFMKAIAFNSASLLEKLQPGKPIDLVVEPQLNEWNGNRTVELTVKDIVVP